MEKDHGATTVTTASAASVRTPRILVLEDQDSIRGMVVAMLRIRSLDCDDASSLAEAREKMARTRYDLLFIDVELPDGSGLSLMEDGRAQGALFVVVTARSDDGHRGRGDPARCHGLHHASRSASATSCSASTGPWTNGTRTCACRAARGPSRRLRG